MLLASLFIVSIIQWHLKSGVFFLWSERDFTSSQDGLTLAEEAARCPSSGPLYCPLSGAIQRLCLGIATVLLAVAFLHEVEKSQNPAATLCPASSGRHRYCARHPCGLGRRQGSHRSAAAGSSGRAIPMVVPIQCPADDAAADAAHGGGRHLAMLLILSVL